MKGCASVIALLITVKCVITGNSPAQSEQNQKSPNQPKQAIAFLGKAKVISLFNDGIICKVTLERDAQRIDYDEPTAIFGKFPRIAVGDQWSGELFSAGKYKYTAANGTTKTILAFATTAEEGASRLVRDRSTAKITQTLKPPFGLKWGQTQSEIKESLREKTVVIKESKDGQGESWNISGLQQTGLRDAIVRFREGRLHEVLVRYQRDGWSNEKYSNLEEQITQSLKRRYASVVPVEDDHERHVKNWKFDTESISIRRIGVRNDQSIEVAYFTEQKFE